jgi:tRNA(fMet)-specific endonuclease VapC
MACLDTTVLIDLGGRGGKALQGAARRKLEGLVAAGEPIVISRFTLAELFVGVHLCDDPATETKAVEAATRPFVILELTPDATMRFGAIVALRRQMGQPIDGLDALIAATASSAGHRLITRNAKDFVGVPGLVVESY